MMQLSAGKALQSIVAVGVLGSLAVAAAPLTWHLRGETRIMPAAGPVTTVTDPAPLAPPDIGPILSLAPFGSADVPETQPQVTAAPLNMTLLGIILRDEPTESMALIDNDGKQANYKPGNKIGDLAILDQVNADHVVLLVDGERQMLAFANAEIADPQSETPPESAADDMNALLSAALAPPASDDYTEPPPPPPPVSTQDYIDLWRERIKANPMQVLDEIGLVASDDGYIIAENHDSGVTRAGLQAGDLVKTVNGKPVGNIDSDRALYDDVANAGLARIEIERDGRTITFSFPLQ